MRRFAWLSTSFMLCLAVGIPRAEASTGAPGSFDTSFGTGGVVAVVDPNLSFRMVTEALDAHAIWIAGYTFDATSPSPTTQLFIRRYSRAGVLDRSFGTNGTLLLPFTGSFAGSGFVDSHERFVVAVNDASTEMVCRFLPHSKLDRTFGSSGCISVGANVGLLQARPNDGALIATFTSSSILFTAVLANGTPDPSLDGTGTVTFASPPQTQNYSVGFSALADGSFVVDWHELPFLGHTTDSIHITSTFHVDATFGGTGELSMATTVGGWTQIRSSTHTFLYATEGSYASTALFRLNDRGRIDRHFGANGFLDLEAAYGPYAYTLLGSAIHDLYLSRTDGTDAWLMRLHGDGSIDAAFGASGQTEMVMPAGVATVEPNRISISGNRVTAFVGHVSFQHQTTQYEYSIQRLFR